MTTVQILKLFHRRTEYKVLREWLSVTERELDDLEPGTCVVPGILFNKLSAGHRVQLVDWAKQWGNQLIMTPPWWNVDMASYLGLGVAIKVEEQETSFKGLPVSHILHSKVTAKWKSDTGENVAVDVRRDSGSGIVTITTVPLLDYRLADQEEVCKRLLAELLQPHVDEQPSQEDEELLELKQSHFYVLLLAAAGINIEEKLATKVQKYLTVPLGEDEEEIRRELLKGGLLDGNGKITVTAEELLDEKGYRAFVRELRKQGEARVW